MTSVLASETLAYRDELIRDGWLLPAGVPGLYGRSAVLEDTVGRIDALVTRLSNGDGAEVLRFPPLISRATFEKSDYLKSFPHLAGAVHSFGGSDSEYRAMLQAAEAGDNWTVALTATGVMLTPAACYPVYPTWSGVVPPEGRLADVLSYCFRHEPSDDPARMLVFRIREQVCAGTPERVEAWRTLWFERALRLAEVLGLEARPQLASDPFFGRTGKLLAATQRDLLLKFEIVAPIASREAPTAIISLNYHREHFSEAFDIRMPDGSAAHTGCVGFGLERIALAMHRAHGRDRESWPADIRQVLSLGAREPDPTRSER